METKVVPYIGGGKIKGAKGDASRIQSSNVWQFLARNEKGATFELPFTN